MNISEEIINLLKEPESPTLEFKAVLPPSRNIAKIVSAFANGDGGILIFGVDLDHNMENKVIGLKEEFRATILTHKAMDLLEPKPQVHYQYVMIETKNVYVIKVEKSTIPVMMEGEKYIRIHGGTRLAKNSIEDKFEFNRLDEFFKINQQLENYKKNTTSSKMNLLKHYQSILKIINDFNQILYLKNVNSTTELQEKKILIRILFSSCVDNFETYLSDLLYEIYLANPSTLKSKQEITVEEVLDCKDLEEFVHYLAKKKIGKLQKGSVKGFIKENRQIRELKVINELEQKKIEKILQIRHLYSHRNGIVDEKFLEYFRGEFSINTEHEMTVHEICETINYLSGIVNDVDIATINKFRLDQVNN